jgi:hypothetical protein
MTDRYRLGDVVPSRDVLDDQQYKNAADLVERQIEEMRRQNKPTPVR